jgi:hypothetical protein
MNWVGIAMPSNANSHIATRMKFGAAYNYAEYLPERRKMMQAWADYLDRLHATERPVTIDIAA